MKENTQEYCVMKAKQPQHPRFFQSNGATDSFPAVWDVQKQSTAGNASKGLS